MIFFLSAKIFSCSYTQVWYQNHIQFSYSVLHSPYLCLLHFFFKKKSQYKSLFKKNVCCNSTAILYVCLYVLKSIGCKMYMKNINANASEYYSHFIFHLRSFNILCFFLFCSLSAFNCVLIFVRHSMFHFSSLLTRKIKCKTIREWEKKIYENERNKWIG